MGHIVDGRLADFARRTGITPATGEWLDTLHRIQKIAFDLIRTAELERSGVRDGDGFWYGSEPLFGLIEDLATINEGRLSPCLRQQEHKPVLVAPDAGDDDDRLDWMREYDEDRARQQATKPVLVADGAGGDNDAVF